MRGVRSCPRRFSKRFFPIEILMLAASVLFVVVVLARSDVGASQQRSLLVLPDLRAWPSPRLASDLFLSPQSSRLALTVIELLHDAHAAAAAYSAHPDFFTLPMTA